MSEETTAGTIASIVQGMLDIGGGVSPTSGIPQTSKKKEETDEVQKAKNRIDRSLKASHTRIANAVHKDGKKHKTKTHLRVVHGKDKNGDLTAKFVHEDDPIKATHTHVHNSKILDKKTGKGHPGEIITNVLRGRQKNESLMSFGQWLVENKPSQREVGTDSLRRIYARGTPGEKKATQKK